MKWKIVNKRKGEDLIKILLENRGLKTKKQQKDFLNPQNPNRLTAKKVGISPVQLNKAVTRIKKAIKNREKIIIYGDYDADGICATAILWETLYRWRAKVMPFIPTREEGYGMKVDRVEKLSKENISLIITVDQGIVAFEAAQKAKELKIDLIITDHHLPEKARPPALAIVHTTQLSGSGVAWFLAKEFKTGDNLDLATIGTITDVMALIGPCRSMVKQGLKELKKTNRPGLRSLFRLAGIEGKEINPYQVGFVIGPRLNAAGRMDDPMDSLRLVCTRAMTRADELARKVDQGNRQRQQLTTETTLHARELWLKQDGKSALIFVSHQSYEHGIIGLVARALADEFYRPAVILAPRGEEWVASARSIEEFNIVEAVRACADILGPHGGHPMSAGFSIKTVKIEILRRRLIGIAAKKLNGEKLSPTLKIDLEVDLESLNLEFYRQIVALEPFGEGNPSPVFASRKIKIVDARTVGADGRHLKLRITNHESRVALDAIAFGLGDLYPQLSPDKPIDIAYNLELNEWNGERKLQLKIKDIKF